MLAPTNSISSIDSKENSIKSVFFKNSSNKRYSSKEQFSEAVSIASIEHLACNFDEALKIPNLHYSNETIEANEEEGGNEECLIECPFTLNQEVQNSIKRDLTMTNYEDYDTCIKKGDFNNSTNNINAINSITECTHLNSNYSALVKILNSKFPTIKDYQSLITTKSDQVTSMIDELSPNLLIHLFNKVSKRKLN